MSTNFRVSQLYREAILSAVRNHAPMEVCYAVHPVAMAPNEAGIVQSGNIMLSRPTWAQAGAKSQGVRTWNRTSCIGGLRKLCENIRRACTSSVVRVRQMRRRCARIKSGTSSVGRGVCGGRSDAAGTTCDHGDLHSAVAPNISD
jgi:hypothetical protein